MAKIRVLSPLDRKAFQSPPVFQSDEKAAYFEISEVVKKITDTFHSPYRKVGFILQWGYFRRAGRFFSPTQFYQQDIIFVSKLLNIDHKIISFEKYIKHRLQQDQQKILELQGFQSFERHPQATALLSQEVTRLVKKQLRPKMIVCYLSYFFFQKKIETPSYQHLAEIILKTITGFEDQLLSTLTSNLSQNHKDMLNQLLPKMKNKKVKNESYYARAPLVALRDIPLSTRTGKIKKNVDGFLTIKQLFESIQTVLQSLSLSPNSLKYYAVWVQKAKITQLAEMRDPYKRYLYLLAFIAHQYYYRQDLLVDTLLQSVQSTLNRIEKKQQEEDKNTKKEKEHATHLLSASYRDKTDLLMKIHSIIKAEKLSAEEKVNQIKILISDSDKTDPNITACIEKLDKQILSSLNKAYFYDALEKQSLALQNRLSRIIRNLDFNALNSKSSLLEAIRYFRETDGKIGHNPPHAFIDHHTLNYIRDSQGKIRPSLYKALLFVHISDAIRSGEINLTHSYRYLSIDEYLIDRKVWLNAHQDFLDRAELIAYSSVNKTIDLLQKTLNEQYCKVNESVNSGENPHISFNKAGEVIVDTPKVEKVETQRIADLLQQENYISILDVLGVIDPLTHFSDCLQHYRVVQQIKRPKPVMFYAGLIGKGCNIGLGKLASVSKGINGNTLETVVNWYFTNDHLMAENNRIIHFINKLALPNIMKKTLGKLHTSSDGQKRNVDLDSILANFSFKYHGSGRDVSIYDFIDERHVLL